MPTDTVTIGGGRLLERPDRKSVSQLMERYPAFSLAATKPRCMRKLAEHFRQGVGADRFAGRENEHTVTICVEFPPAPKIAIKRSPGAVRQGHQS